MTLQAAVEAYQRGDRAGARRLILPVARAEANNEQAWLLLAYVAENEIERNFALERVLTINPQNSYAIQLRQEAGSAAPVPPAAEASSNLFVSEPIQTRGSSEQAGQGIGGIVQDFEIGLGSLGALGSVSDSPSRAGGTYQMLWDCQYCGTKKLLGKTHRFCPNCGAAQNPDARYFPSDDEKVAVENHVYVGADLICGSCSTPNSASAEFCRQCGVPLTGAVRAEILADETREAGEKFESGGSRDVVKEKFDAEMERVGVKKPSRAASATPEQQRRNTIIIGAIIAAAVVLVGALIFIFTRTRDASVMVAGHSWERIIYVQEFGPQRHSDWQESVPAGAYNRSCREEVRSHRQVPDGQECSTRRVDNGDGTYREQEECHTRYRDEPVYDTRCDYTLDEWYDSRQATSSGDSLSDTPAWPDANIRTGNCRGCERERSRSERYTVRFAEVEGESTYTCDFDQAQWQSFAVRSRWTMQVGAVLNQPRCDTLQASG